MNRTQQKGQHLPMVGRAWRLATTCYRCGEVSHLQKDYPTCSGKGTADENRAKPRKPANRKSGKLDFRGFGPVTQWASASDNSHLSLKSRQQEFSMSPLHQKRNRKQWVLLCGSLGPHENPVVSEMQPST